MTITVDSIEKKVEMCWLLSFYGGMMTERQREMLQLYYEEDLSLGEIAKESNVSRQCVHNTLQRAKKQLGELEGRLRLVSRFRQIQSLLSIIRHDLDFVVATPDTHIYLLNVKHDLDDMIAAEEK